MGKASPNKKTARRFAHGAYFSFLLVGVAAGAYFGIPAAIETSYDNKTIVGTSTSVAPPAVKPASDVTHVAIPQAVKAIYMSQCVVGTPSFRSDLVELIDSTELNAVVIDIRDYTGKIAFPTDHPMLKDSVSDECGARDMKAFIKTLHEKNIYVIGRITTFQNPYYAKLHPELAVQKVGGGVWHDYKGLAFIDVGAKPYWETVVALGKVSYEEMGFDELNFDYLRFPSDGPMKEADYTWSRGKSKAEVLEEFYQYLSENLRPTGAVLSADLFGYVTVHEDDLGIGQILERAFPYFDYIAPMVYPSHYNKGFAGLQNVNSDPYLVVKTSLLPAVARALSTTSNVPTIGSKPIMETVEVPATATTPTTTKQVPSGKYEKASYGANIIRPWLQSFDYPVPYTPQMVAGQIKANEEAGLNSYLFWDAANKYTSLRKVLVAEGVSTGAAQ